MIPTVRHEIIGPANTGHSLRIAHLSDLHLWFSGRKMRRIESVLEEWKPEVLALTGDFADTPWGQQLARAWIQRLAATYPVCWIAGNHDHWWGRSFLQGLATVAEAHPIDRNDAFIVSKTGRRFRFTGWPRLDQGVLPEGVRAGPTAILLHDPAQIDPARLVEKGECLVLAGHLHGGQLTLWTDRFGRPQPAASCYKWLAERTEIGLATLIVSRGLGDTLPLRIRTPHEIVVIDWRVS